VHEAYLELIDDDGLVAGDRTHSIRIAARSMRRLLVAHARRRNTQNRGGQRRRVDLSDSAVLAVEPETDLLVLDEALDRLAEIDPRRARVVELRFFGGLPIAAIATAVSISVRSVHADWAAAKAWLRRELADGVEPA